MLRYVAYHRFTVLVGGDFAQEASFPLRFCVSRELAAGARVLRVEGEIDISTAEPLRTHLDEALAEAPPKPVVCDLEAVTFLDSIGIGVLTAAAGRAEAIGQVFCVAGARGQVRRTLQLVGLLDMLPCFATRADALAPGGAALDLRAQGRGWL